MRQFSEVKQFNILILVLLVSPFATAQTQLTVPAENTDQVVNRYVFQSRILLANYKYEEPGLMQIDGLVAGFFLEGKRNFLRERIFLVADAEYMMGNTYYKGTYFDTGEPTPDIPQRDLIYTIRALAGANAIVMKPNQFLDIRTGYGYRYANNDSAYDREREQTYLFIPIEIGWNTSFAATKIRLSYEYDHFLEGENRTHWEEVDPAYRTQVYSQQNGRGSQISLLFMKTLQNINLTAQVYHRLWDIEDSKPATLAYHSGAPVLDTNGRSQVLYEPKNTTKITGISFGAQF